MFLHFYPFYKLTPISSFDDGVTPHYKAITNDAFGEMKKGGKDKQEALLYKFLSLSKNIYNILFITIYYIATCSTLEMSQNNCFSSNFKSFQTFFSFSAI